MAKKKAPVSDKSWYSIEAAAKDAPAKIHVYGPIVNNDMMAGAVTAKGFIDDLADIDAESIDLHINSGGGAVFAGIAIANAMRQHESHITAHIDGVAASIATIVALAADEVFMAKDALFMIHQPHGMAGGNAKGLRKLAKTLDKVSDVMVGTYVENSNLSREEVIEAMDDETWYTADEAKAAGFISGTYEGAKLAACALPEGVYNNAPAILAGNGPTLESAQEESPMPTSKKGQTPKVQATDDNASDAIDTQAIAAEAAQAALEGEQSRRTGIEAVFENFPSSGELRAECLADMQMSVTAATNKLLGVLGEKAAPLGGDAQPNDTAHKDKFLAGITEGMLIRAGVVKDEKGDNPFRTFGLQDTARAVLEHNGMATRDMPTDQIIKAALTHSTGDFANVYENIMHKTLLGAFRNAPDTWTQIAQSGDVSDFRAHNRYRAGSFADLQGLNENGEIRNVTTGDAEKETITAGQKAVIFNLSYDMIVNDDMGYFLTIARNLGRAARRSVENDVYSLLTSASGLGPNMGDGVALFNSAHGNLAGTGTTISVATIGAARAAMLAQKDPDSNEFLDIRPAILLVPVAKGDHARQVVNSETDWGSNANSKKINPIRNLVTVLETPRLTGNAWYLFSAPSELPALEVGFLNGQTEPQLAIEEAFNTRGVKYRITYDYGVAAVEYRAVYRNPGA